ncbi:Box C/D snoRNA protein 1 [Arachnomyces sp. PD_36]|nr:Box C/D snoRNA protein 1 [Arachnomyces sp. PD_36]
MSGHEDALLSELCSICHEQPPKYCCPRCSTRTCSLPCTKRHKLWSQCSGVRDPAAYVKKTELETPSGFDRDFNFITSIERGIERADRETGNREIPLNREDGMPGRRGRNFMKGEPGFQKGIVERNIRVVRAPKGMSRSKQNSSRWNAKQRCISWTIEWVTPDGEKSRSNSVETCTISEAYTNAGMPKKMDKKRKLNHPHDSNRPAPGLASAQSQKQKEGKEPEPSPAKTLTLPPTQQPQPEQENNSTKQLPHTSPESSDKTPSSSQLHFYLHRPQTRSKLPVLIPLSPDVTIKDTLGGRVVLEFPTIYALAQAPEYVPRDKFMLEEEYILKESEGLEVLDELDTTGENTDREEGEVTESGLPKDVSQVDEKKVFEMLKKDLETHPLPKRGLW